MKGKLIKTDKQEYRLYTNDSLPFATTDNSPYKKLSLKNCEAIELGYDLDELADTYAHKTCEDMYKQLGITGAELGWEISFDFKAGFQKAIQILGDKKFSEEDLSKAILLSRSMEETFDTIVKSLQQNEWQVEVLTDKIPADLAPGGWDVFPKLDAENCLILKRVE